MLTKQMNTPLQRQRVDYMNKVMDVTPATNFMQQMVASTNHALIGLTLYRTRIPVQFVEAEAPLGTEDGQDYTVHPQLPDNDEEGQHGRQTTQR